MMEMLLQVVRICLADSCLYFPTYPYPLGSRHYTRVRTINLMNRLFSICIINLVHNITCSEKSGRKYDQVEGNIVFAQELHALDASFWVLPPLGPLVRVARRDADVADGGVEPGVEHLVREPLERHGYPPLEVPRDAPRLQTLLQPRSKNI